MRVRDSLAPHSFDNVPQSVPRDGQPRGRHNYRYPAQLSLEDGLTPPTSSQMEDARYFPLSSIPRPGEAYPMHAQSAADRYLNPLHDGPTNVSLHGDQTSRRLRLRRSPAPTPSQSTLQINRDATRLNVSLGRPIRGTDARLRRRSVGQYLNAFDAHWPRSNCGSNGHGRESFRRSIYASLTDNHKGPRSN